jgi:Glycosyl transferase family 2
VADRDGGGITFSLAPDSFVSASIILPLMTETESLRQSVDIILEEARADVSQILIVVCDRTRLESLAVAHSLAQTYPDLIQVNSQSLPFLGGAIREGFERSTGSHVIMMASDLETDPHDVKRLITESKAHPRAIITASRWREGGGFSGYAPVKFLANRIFQFIFSALYATDLSDLTYGYRLFPVALVKAIKWEELRHPFLLETIVKPLRLGVPVVEISSRWRARVEGESQNTFMRNFTYFRIGLRVRFMRAEQILRAS